MLGGRARHLGAHHGTNHQVRQHGNPAHEDSRECPQPSRLPTLCGIIADVTEADDRCAQEKANQEQVIDEADGGEEDHGSVLSKLEGGMMGWFPPSIALGSRDDESPRCASPLDADDEACTRGDCLASCPKVRHDLEFMRLGQVPNHTHQGRLRIIRFRDRLW